MTPKLRRLLSTARPRRASGAFEPYPSGAPLFDRQYVAGDWDYLADAAEAPRYGAVAAYCRHFASGGRVLDIGCGVGLLASHLDVGSQLRYVGVDLSAEAVAVARSRHDEHGEFVVADVYGYRPEGRFEAVVFNEVLYYLDDPGEVVAQYGRTLTPRGVMIVSHWDGLGAVKSAQLWRAVLRGHDVLAETHLISNGDTSWTVRVLRLPT